jgi:hypothetical protein
MANLEALTSKLKLSFNDDLIQTAEQTQVEEAPKNETK